MKKIYSVCPFGWMLFLLSSAVIVFQRIMRNNHELMTFLSRVAVKPIHSFLAQLTSVFPFSVAEILIGCAGLTAVVYLILQIVLLIKKGNRIKRIIMMLVTICAAVSFVYAGFCILWGIYYYGDDFGEMSGLSNEPVSVEQLEKVTAYFADILNQYADIVERDDNGVYSASRESIIEKSSMVYAQVEKDYPCLQGMVNTPKGIYFSKIMSYLDFTGFFFPFTAEANVNMDFPQCMLASTIAHELAHQRGVAKEQEANFVAVLACMSFDDPDYIYSGSMLAYTHLGNALYSADYEAWEKIYRTLNENVIEDFKNNSLYWKQYETPVQEASNTIYEGFLQSYDQTLGLRSYGACVDMLVNFYCH